MYYFCNIIAHEYKDIVLDINIYFNC